MRGPWCVVGLLSLALGLADPRPARALDWDALGGHFSLGYAKLFVEHAPGGSFSVAGGVDREVAPGLRLGVDAGYHLLGSRTAEQGSLFATLDYSLFEASLLAHWSPPGLWPLNRISIGPALMSARSQPSGGGAGFSRFAVDELAAGIALDVTVMRRAPSPLRLGLEVGARRAFLVEEDWTVATARIAVHY